MSQSVVNIEFEWIFSVFTVWSETNFGKTHTAVLGTVAVGDIAVGVVALCAVLFFETLFGASGLIKALTLKKNCFKALKNWISVKHFSEILKALKL